MTIRTRASNAFIAWLRQVRRSAWLLIALCMIFRAGDALVDETPIFARGTAALAEE